MNIYGIIKSSDLRLWVFELMNINGLIKMSMISEYEYVNVKSCMVYIERQYHWFYWDFRLLYKTLLFGEWYFNVVMLNYVNVLNLIVFY